MRTVQIPDEIYQQASRLAEEDHVSVDRLVSALVREGVGEWSRVQDRAARGSLAKLRQVLDKVADVPAAELDRL